jgi:hypothetical protein
MAYTIQANRRNLSVTLHFTSNSVVTIAGNNSVSNVAIGSEVLTGAYITQAWFGSSSGANAYWRVKRGANTVAVFDSTAYIDFAGCGNPLTIDSTGTLVVDLIGGTDGYLMLELTKQGTFPNTYFTDV